MLSPSRGLNLPGGGWLYNWVAPGPWHRRVEGRARGTERGEEEEEEEKKTRGREEEGDSSGDEGARERDRAGKNERKPTPLGKKAAAAMTEAWNVAVFAARRGRDDDDTTRGSIFVYTNMNNTRGKPRKGCPRERGIGQRVF